MTQRKSTIITATYRIVTPMFCAGADQSSAELRLPSFKGALRFWWRTLMWGKVADHHELRKREARIFGASDSKFGQSKVRLRIVDPDLADVVKPPTVFESGRLLGAHYLGYGAMEAFESRKKGTKAGQLTRGMIPEGTFTVEGRVSPIASREQVDEVKRSLVLLGTVGGLGSKSRKGFGSLTITHLTVDGKRDELPLDLVERLRSTVSGLPESLPNWTAWHAGTRVVAAQSTTASRALELLDQIGREQVHFRSWGSDNRGRFPEHRTLELPSEQNFKYDHDLSKRSSPGQAPHRVAFGLPHNYQTGGVKPAQHERRASPLFIHLDQVTEDTTPTALLAFLPSQFLPDAERLNAFNRDADTVEDNSLWYPIHGFLDRLLSNGSSPKLRPGYEHFPDGKIWWKKQDESINAQEVKLG